MRYIEKKYLTHKINEYATHQPFLWHILKKTSKPILELGSGYGSTPLLHAYSAKHGIPLYTLDHDAEWLSRFSSLKSELHRHICVDITKGWDAFQEAVPKGIEWGIVFVDQGSWESRVDCARILKEKADYILVHDFDNLAANFGFGKVVQQPDIFDMSSEFTHWRTCLPVGKPWPLESGPPTLVASMKYSDLTVPEELELENEFIDYIEYFTEPE